MRFVTSPHPRAARRAGVYWGVALKARPTSRLGSSQKQRNRKHSSIRSRVEHVFRVIKCQFGYTKVRYKGLAKNAAQVFSWWAWRTSISSERRYWHDGSNPSAAWGNPPKATDFRGSMSQNTSFLPGELKKRPHHVFIDKKSQLFRGSLVTLSS
jgi:Transposase DDE domain